MLYTAHTPVLLDKTLDCLKPESGRLYIDATVGLGGHASAILDASAPDGRLFGIDQDPNAIRAAQARLLRFGERATVRQANFAELARVAPSNADGILMDLGISSAHLESSGRGFSFQRDEPLDMRMNPETSVTAADVVNRYPQERLAKILWEFGEERRSRQIAASIVERRKIENFRTTGQLVAAIGRGRPGGRIHPATRVFQALRIEVNTELDRLRVGLVAALGLLTDGGRLCVISFHSLEDRLVKRFFRNACRADDRLRLLTNKPIVAGEEERKTNPRSRSAKLRALLRTNAAREDQHDAT